MSAVNKHAHADADDNRHAWPNQKSVSKSFFVHLKAQAKYSGYQCAPKRISLISHNLVLQHQEVSLFRSEQ